MSGDLALLLCETKKKASVSLRQDINDGHLAKGRAILKLCFCLFGFFNTTTPRPTFPHSLVSTTIANDEETLTR